MELFKRIKRNMLILISFLFYIIITILLMYNLDKNIYQSVKKEQLFNRIDDVMTLYPLDELTSKARRFFTQREPIDKEEDFNEIQELINEILDDDNIYVEIALISVDGEKKEDVLRIRRPEKLKKQNNYSNSLFLSDFTALTDYKVHYNPKILDRISVTFTTPGPYQENMAWVGELTQEYRRLAMIVVLVWSLIYALVVITVFLPMKRVMNKLEFSHNRFDDLIFAPKTLLEKAYNLMARDSILQKLNKEFASELTQQQSTFKKNIYKGLAEIVSPFFSDREIVFAPIPEQVSSETLKTLTENNKSIVIKNAGEFAKSQDINIDDSEKQGVLVPVLIDEKTAAYGLVPMEKKVVSKLRPWDMQTLDLIGAQIGIGIKTNEMHRKLIVREKSEANINLSRNLGHDLTNIIATSKLDIMAARAYLRSMDKDGQEKTERDKIFGKSIEGIINTTKFLQEIVNIYRAFTYIKKPKYEQMNINEVIDEMTFLFQLTTTQKLQIETNYSTEIPGITVEPRLLKLAFFNLIVNAINSIKERSGDSDYVGKVTISTTINEKIKVSLKDNGMGIRRGDGELANDAEIAQIFQYGVTSRDEEGGEGLGLSWVLTIIEDFHGGAIMAKNNPDGGAEFIITLDPAFHPKEQ